MHVPRVIVGVRDFGPDDLDHAGAGLDEAAGEEERLAEGIHAVAGAHLVVLAVDGEGVARLAAGDEVEGLAVVFVEVVIGDGLVDVGHRFLNGLAEGGAALEALGVDLGPQVEVIDMDAVHLGHVEVVAIGEERVGIEGFAEEAGGAALADDVGFLQRAREHHEGEHRLGGWLEADDVRAEIRVILRTRGFELAGGRDLVGRVAGHDLVDRGGVVEEPVGRVASSS